MANKDDENYICEKDTQSWSEADFKQHSDHLMRGAMKSAISRSYSNKMLQ